MTPPATPARSTRIGLAVTVVVSLLAGVGLGVGLLLGVLPVLPVATTTVGPPLDLHAVAWGEATLPGSVCRSPAPISLHDGQAGAVPSSFDGPAPNYPQDVTVDAEAVVFGDLTGDGHDEAALPLRCGNHQATAAGTTVSTALLFDGSSGAAVLLGSLPSSQPRLGELPNLVTVTQLLPGRVVGAESFYGPADANCCPSGRSRTTWPWTGTILGAPEAAVVGDTATDTTGNATAAADTTTAEQSSSAGVDAETLAASAARATPQLDQRRVVTTRCAARYLTGDGAVVGCSVRDRGGQRVAVVEVQLVDLASRDTRTYVAVPGSGCPDLPDWAAKNIGDMESDSPC